MVWVAMAVLTTRGSPTALARRYLTSTPKWGHSTLKCDSQWVGTQDLGGTVSRPSASARSHILSVLPSGSFPGVDDVDIYEFLDRHPSGLPLYAFCIHKANGRG